MARNKTGAKKKSIWLPRIIALFIIAAIMAVSFIWASQINHALGLIKVDESAYDGESTDEVLEFAAGSDKTLTVHYVDVGQGDACVIELPDDKKILIDGGKDKEKQKLLDYLDNTIDPDNAMENKKTSGAGYGFDYAILTHADEDHCGGIDDVLKKYGAQTFYRPNELSSYKTYADPGKSKLFSPYSEQATLAYMKAIDDGYKNSALQHVFDDSDSSCFIKSEAAENSPEYYEFTFYVPTYGQIYKDRNDYSPIMILEFQGRRFMFSGDSEKAGEADFVRKAKAKTATKYEIFDDNFTVDVIKPGHHGSKTSSSQGFLDALTTPSYIQNVLIVFSCGFNNSYGHPHTETMERLKNMGVSEEHLLRTDTNGTVVLAVNEGAIMYGANVVRVEKPAVAIAGPVNLQWIELCITLWVLLAVILLVQPFVSKNRRKIKKATGIDIAKYVPDTSGSLNKIDDTVSASRKNTGKSGGQTKTSAADIFDKLSAASVKSAKKSPAKKSSSAPKKTTTAKKSTTAKKPSGTDKTKK